MGTRFRLVLFGDPSAAAKAAMAALERIEQLEQVMSDYREDSELNQASRIAWTEPRILSPDLYAVLDAALELGRASGGALDITVRPLVELWRLARHQKRLPDSRELETARKRVGIDKVLLNPRTRSLRLAVPGVKLDLGAVGKGYAADQVLALLARDGWRSVMVDAGGDFAVGAAPPGRPGWRLAIDDGSDFQRTVVIRNRAVATSGDRHRHLEIDGVRYSHVVDPATGYGLTHRGAATVIAPTALLADGLATALNVMPIEAGLALARRLGAEASIRRQSGSESPDLHRTPEFPS